MLCAALACALASVPASAAGRAAPRADATIEVSFAPDAFVRLRGARFVALSGAGTDALNDVLARHGVARVQRSVAASEGALDATRRRLLADGNRVVPDLNRHYRIVVRDAADRAELVAALRDLAIVDAAVPEPEPIPPPATPSFTTQQRYSGVAPGGINAPALAAREGGLGQEAKIIDIEYSWNLAHEDLENAAGGLIANGVPSDPFANVNHGTAVLGELAGTDNGFGVKGLAPQSPIGVINAYTSTGYAMANAVELARQDLDAGDVILLEQQWTGIAGTGSESSPYVPIEYLASVYDAIRLATQDGIIVVEAAGNGGVNLNDPTYAQPFPGGKPDSGAIIVGAGTGDAACSSTANARLPYSTYGTRVNLQGWGQCVTTTGYGSLYDNGENARYTASFNGTSSASPIVAAAAALYSSVFQSETGRAPSPKHVRSRLMATGTAQAGGGGNIGPLPNLQAAANGYDGTPPTVTVGGPAGPTNDPTPQFTFTSSEAGSTFECRLGAASFAPCSSPHTLAPQTDGPRSFEVRATDAAFNTGPATTRSFTIDTVAPTASLAPASPSLTNDATPTFSFSSSEPGSTFACRAGTAAAPGSFAACSSPHTTGSLPDGTLTFEVRPTDAAGNAGASATHTFTVDTVAPAVTIGDGPPDPTDDATPTFTFSSDDPGASFSCRSGSAAAPGTFTPCASPHTTAPLPAGPVVFEVRATDGAANTGAAASRAFTVAAEPPSTGGSGTPAPLPVPTVPGVTPADVAPSFSVHTKTTVRPAKDGWVRLAKPQITCPSLPPACSVTVTVRRVLAGNPKVASAKVTIAAGKTATVRFRLQRTARKALKRRGHFVANVKLEARHGSATKVRTVRVTFRR